MSEAEDAAAAPPVVVGADVGDEVGAEVLAVIVPLAPPSAGLVEVKVDPSFPVGNDA